ncbi:MAG: hypothetical protein HY876_02145, partial [Coriobacteriales bacterium]|nr:hypothetical protein [Coriobacteriales bacterium]
ETFAEVGRLTADPERRFAALVEGIDDSGLQALCDRLRCSRAQARRVRYFLHHGLDADPKAEAPRSPIGGNAIIAELGVAPGPLVGMVKTALAEAVGDGLLDPDNREAVLDMARGILGTRQIAQAKGDGT